MFTADQLNRFLHENWGKAPQLFRQAIDVSRYPLSPETLCELTGNELVESRLITEDMEVVHGPFENDGQSAQLLPDGSMLLVQCLEQHLESIRAIQDEQFDFIPDWQVDDVMASLGYMGANCGAHFDQYDVFLVQHSGSKTWHLDQGGHEEADLDPASEVRLLAKFEATTTFVTEPGDVLYVPPGFGHHGICEDASLTLSVGIRNPTMAELLADLSEFALLSLQDNPTINTRLFTDQKEIKGQALEDVLTAVGTALGPQLLQQWFGSFSTRLREPEVLIPGEKQVLGAGMIVEAVLASRIASADNLLFVNGDVFELPLDDKRWVGELAEHRTTTVSEAMSEEGISCLEQLVSSGALRTKKVHST